MLRFLVVLDRVQTEARIEGHERSNDQGKTGVSEETTRTCTLKQGRSSET